MTRSESDPVERSLPAPGSGSNAARGASNAARGAGASHRSGVLHVLSAADRPLTSAEIADDLGIHKNTVRFHLESLLDSGQVEQVEPIRSRPGRPAQVFRAVRRMDPTGPRHYELLAGVLTEALLAEPDGVARAVAAGRSWGQRAATAIAEPATDGRDGDDRDRDGDGRDADPVTQARSRLVALLDRFGFAPDHDRDEEPDSGGAVPSIGVRHCPFLELASDHQRIVCGVHLGLMRGALARWGAPFDADTLVPFVEPDRCLVQLSPPGAAGPRSSTSQP